MNKLFWMFFSGLLVGMIFSAFCAYIIVDKIYFDWFQNNAYSRVSELKLHESITTSGMPYPVDILRGNAEADLGIVKSYIDEKWYIDCDKTTTALVENANKLNFDHASIPKCS